MSYYQLAAAYKYTAWYQIIDRLKSVSSFTQACYVTHFNNADTNVQNDDGKLFVWNRVDNNGSFDLFYRLLDLNFGLVNNNNFKAIISFDGGFPQAEGNWDPNSFGLTTKTIIDYDDVPSINNGEFIDINNLGPAIRAVPAKKPMTSLPPVNDHKCTSCGNTACSKTEKSCWKCGSLIVI